MERQDLLRVFVYSRVFVFIDDALTEVKPIKTEFSYDHVEENMAYYRASHIVELPDGSSYTVNSYDGVFDSVEDFKKGNPSATDFKSVYGRYGTVMYDTLGWCSQVNSYWTMENGEPVHKMLDLEHFSFNYETNKFEVAKKPSEPLYSSRDKCISYNDIKVIDNEGNTSINTGINKLLQLDDDQKELVGQLENLIREMASKDIFLLMDCCERITAYNFRNVDDCVLYCDTTLSSSEVGENENPNDYELADRYGKPFEVDATVSQWGDDSRLFIKRKK